MLSSSKTREAFDLSREPDRVRSATAALCRGRACWQPGCWRKLVCRSSPVHAEIFGSMGHSYDMHENNFGMLKDANLPDPRPGISGIGAGPGGPWTAPIRCWWW